MSKSIFFVIIILYCSAFSADIDIGLGFLSQGKYDEAVEYIKRAYKNVPFSPIVKFAYARTVANGIEVKKLYEEVIENKSASDSLKAEAYYQLGCLYYCREEYDSAESMFSQAEKLSAIDKNTQMRALAVFNKGDNRAPESLWLTMVSDESNKNTNKARYYLGNSFYRQKKYEQAYNCYNKASESKNEAWAVPALTGACLSAYNHGNTSRGTILYEQILNDYPLLLERELLKSVDTTSHSFSEADNDTRNDFGAVDSEVLKEKKVSEKKTERVGYTLQVGAFSSLKNAQIMSKEMKKDFGHVTIKKEKVKGKKLHKVRVGSFTEEKDALAYGEKHLKGRGITFRVVKE